MSDPPRMLQGEVVLPSDNTNIFINRKALDAIDEGRSSRVTRVEPGVLWRECDGLDDELRQALTKQQRHPSALRDHKMDLKSLEHKGLYCRELSENMKLLTLEQASILLPLSAGMRVDFYRSGSMQVAVKCQPGDQVVAIDPALVEEMSAAKGTRCTVRFKGPLPTPFSAYRTYFGLLSVEPIDESDGQPLLLIQVPGLSPVSARNILRLSHTEENGHRAIVCTAEWLSSEYQPQFDRPVAANGNANGNGNFFHIDDRVVFQLAANRIRRGRVVWLGRLGHCNSAGVEFDGTIEDASCYFNGRKMFDGKEGCCRLIAVSQLQMECDFDAHLNQINPPAHNGDSAAAAANFDRRVDEAGAMMDSRGLQIGSMVKLTHLDISGCILWFGFLPRHEELVVGVDVNDASSIEPGTGVLDPRDVLAIETQAPRDVIYTDLSLLEADTAKTGGGGCGGQPNVHQSAQDKWQFGNDSFETIPGLVNAPAAGSWTALAGRNRGIQGHHNSCYLDSTLFAMFATSEVFDCVLERPRDAAGKDVEHFDDIQRCLREGIVNCLRQNQFVRADRVLELRRHLDKLGVIPGMMTEEKDPEEFINLLLDHALRHEPFIQLSTGQSCHVLQLFLDKANLPFEEDAAAAATSSGCVADTETLLHLSLIQSNIQLNQPPKCLILQMPRSGKSYKMFHRILPVLELNITNLLSGTARACGVCGKLATMECHQCFLKHDSGRDYTYCASCFKTFVEHRKDSEGRHQGLEIQYPEEIKRRYANNRNVDRQTVMDLLAVVCIGNSHCVCFLRAEPAVMAEGRSGRWLFFDSMADREGASDNGFTIPEVTLIDNMEEWLDNVRLQERSSSKPSEHVTRLLEDCYLCFYGNPRTVSV